MLDTVLKNGKIIDGSGNPWFYGDVGMKDGEIVAIGAVDVDAKKTVDLGGKCVAPGFIDGHCHSDLMILDFPESEIKLQQGVTTEVIGNCGLAPVPVNPLHKEDLERYIEPVIGKSNVSWKWETIEQYFEQLDKSLIAENIASYVAHGSVRIAVMGFANREPTSQELREMKYIVEQGMKAGAIGLSIGLLYAPGSYANKKEIAELCKVVAKYNGILATHIRGEGNNLLPSIEEVIWIAEQSGVPLHISHLKAAGKRNWGQVNKAMEYVESARAKGMDVTCDVYPYNAGSTMLTTLLPPWSLEGGIDVVLDRLTDATVRAQMKKELEEEQTDWDNLVHSTGWDSVIISSVQNEQLKKWEGRSIAEISAHFGKDPVETAFDLLLEENGNIGIVYFHMDEADVVNVMSYSKALIASDSLTCYTGKPHPRLYGTFPKVLAEYVREKNILTIEEAIRKITSFPAQRFGLKKRGFIEEGYVADIVVFDENLIKDHATYGDPKQYPDGIDFVYVNGNLTIDRSRHTSSMSGKFLRYER